MYTNSKREWTHRVRLLRCPPFFVPVTVASDDPIALFTLAYEQHAQALLRHCRYQMSDPERAKEIMQEAFMRTWEYLKSGKRVEHMKTFLFRVANNLIVDDARRRKGKELVSLDDLQEKGFDPGYDDMESTQQKVDVWKTLLHVKQKEYKLLRMRYMEGMRPTDIANVLGLAPNTVAVRLHRALKEIGQKFFAGKKRNSLEQAPSKPASAAA